MNASVGLQLVAAVSVAVMVVRYWRQILAAVAVVVLALALLGLMTVISHWP